MTKQHAVGTSATSEPIGKASKPSTEKKGTASPCHSNKSPCAPGIS